MFFFLLKGLEIRANTCFIRDACFSKGTQDHSWGGGVCKPDQNQYWFTCEDEKGLYFDSSTFSCKCKQDKWTFNWTSQTCSGTGEPTLDHGAAKYLNSSSKTLAADSALISSKSRQHKTERNSTRHRDEEKTKSGGNAKNVLSEESDGKETPTNKSTSKPDLENSGVEGIKNGYRTSKNQFVESDERKTPTNESNRIHDFEDDVDKQIKNGGQTTIPSEGSDRNKTPTNQGTSIPNLGNGDEGEIKNGDRTTWNPFVELDDLEDGGDEENKNNTTVYQLPLMSDVITISVGLTGRIAPPEATTTTEPVGELVDESEDSHRSKITSSNHNSSPTENITTKIENPTSHNAASLTSKKLKGKNAVQKFPSNGQRTKSGDALIGQPKTCEDLDCGVHSCVRDFGGTPHCSCSDGYSSRRDGCHGMF